MSRHVPVPCPSRLGFTILELTLVLLIGAVLTAPLVGMGVEARNRALVRHASETAVALLARGRWAAIMEGGVAVEFTSQPPTGTVVSPRGDTILHRRFGTGGVELELSRGRPRARIVYGPMGLGVVASQTLRFRHGGEEESLIISSLGRVRRGE